LWAEEPALSLPKGPLQLAAVAALPVNCLGPSLRSELVTFSKLPEIDAANKTVTTTKSSKIQKSHKLSR
jgi:hypothetical protein